MLRPRVPARSPTDIASRPRPPIADARAPRTLAFCFSDQGGPPLGPRTSSLCGVSAAFTTVVDICFAHARLVAPEDTAALGLFALQTALAAMWAVWGVVPPELAGNSFDEYATLVLVHVLKLRDAPSAMAALQLPLPAVRALPVQQRTRALSSRA